MSRTVVIKAHRIGPSTVALDEPLPEGAEEVEVIARVSEAAATRPTPPRLSDYLRSLPPGTRTAEDIDRQFREERDSDR